MDKKLISLDEISKQFKPYSYLQIHDMISYTKYKLKKKNQEK